jgi:diacylglycerol kinase family enzyme
MKHLFIINPAAGKGKGIKYAEAIRKYFELSDEPYRIVFTDGPGDATKIARKYVSADQ